MIRRIRARVREHVRLLVAVVAAATVLILVAIDVTLHYGPAVHALKDGRDALVQAESVSRDASHLDRATLRQVDALLSRAEVDFGSASSAVDDGWLLGIAGHLPWLSGQVAGLRTLRHTGQDAVAVGKDVLGLVQTALTPTTAAQPIAAAATPGRLGGDTLGRLVVAVASNPQVVPTMTRDLAGLQDDLRHLAEGALVWPLGEPQATALREGGRMATDLRPVPDILRALPDILGPGEHRYLLLLANPGEERPGGGFIGAIGAVTYRDGEPVSETFRDSYFANPLVTGIPAPRALDDYLFHGHPLDLADANWSPDFPTSAAEVTRFYTRATGETVDGVIDVDPVALGYFLSVLGPVQVPPYPQVITAENALRELNYITNMARPGDPGKVFLAPFGRTVLDLILHAPIARDSALLDAARRGVAEKHIAIAFVDPNLERLAANAGADGRLAAAPTSDGIFICDANISGTKGDLFVDRHFDLTAEVGSNGLTFDRATLVYTNRQVDTPADRNLEPNSGGAYRDYVRVYVPADATVDDIILTRDGRSTPSAPSEVGIEDGRRYIGIPIVVSPGSTTALAIDYHGLFARVADGRVDWSLLWSKQINALSWDVSVEVDFPGGLSRAWKLALDRDQKVIAGT